MVRRLLWAAHGSITYTIIITITIRSSSCRLISINNSRTHRNHSSCSSNHLQFNISSTEPLTLAL